MCTAVTLSSSVDGWLGMPLIRLVVGRGGGGLRGVGSGGVGVRASVHEGEEAPGRKGDGGARAH